MAEAKTQVSAAQAVGLRAGVAEPPLAAVTLPIWPRLPTLLTGQARLALTGHEGKSPGSLPKGWETAPAGAMASMHPDADIPTGYTPARAPVGMPRGRENEDTWGQRGRGGVCGAKRIKAGKREGAREENNGLLGETGRERVVDSQRERVSASCLLGERGKKGALTTPLTITEASYPPKDQYS